MSLSSETLNCGHVDNAGRHAPCVPPCRTGPGHDPGSRRLHRWQLDDGPDARTGVLLAHRVRSRPTRTRCELALRRSALVRRRRGRHGGVQPARRRGARRGGRARGAHSAGCHITLAAAALAPVSRVVLREPPDLNAKRVSPALWQQLDSAAARGDRKAVVRLLINDVVGANTGMRIPWFVFPVLFRSRFGKMSLANALRAPPSSGRTRPTNGMPATSPR